MRTSKGAESTLDMSSRTPNSIGMDVPVMSAIRACHQVVPGMLSSGVGSIINILTPASYFPLPWMAPYTASRCALNGFSQSLYLELKGQGIHVGSLCPGRVDTDYIARNSTDFGWWPLIACIFPTLTTERVAERVLLGIRKQRREQIFPVLLWVFVRAFVLFPKTVLRVLEWTRLLQPPALADSIHTRQTEQPITIDNATNWEESIQLNIIDESDPGLLQALRSSYGLFGLICDVTFRVQQQVALLVRHITYTLDQFEIALSTLKQQGESIMYYLFPFSNTLTVELRRYRPGKAPSGRKAWFLRNLAWKSIAPAYSALLTRWVANKSLRFQLINGFYRLLQVLLNRCIKSDASFANDQIIRYPEQRGLSKYTLNRSQSELMVFKDRKNNCFGHQN